MLSEPRTINLLTELIHVPAKHTVENLRNLYNSICSSCGYENFIRTADGARVESSKVDQSKSEGTQGSSSVTFRQDRIIVLEDRTALALEEYVERVETVARSAMEILKIPLFLVQQSTVRSLASPNFYRSAGEFLGKSLFKIREEELEPLGRPANIFGLRLLFPATPDNNQQFNVRIESYVKDPRSVYIENVGVYKNPIQYQNLDVLGQNMEATAEFLSSNLCGFLTQYDRKDPAV